MVYNFNGKDINIKDEEIDNYVNTLEISIDEAIQLWLADNDYIEDEEEAKLTQKAKDNRIMATIHEAKGEEPRAKRKVERKENPDKEMIIAATAEMLKGLDGIESIAITNVGKVIEFRLNGKAFKFDLIQRREKKA